MRATVRRRGKVIIPAFAVGRTQEIVYALNQLEAGGDIPPLQVFVDSPLAVNVTEVFRIHPEEWDAEVRVLNMAAGRGRNPFDFSRLEYVRDAGRSKQLNFLTEPAIIISASGMAESGRILHHLKNNIENADNTVVFVGYQAENTLGRRILDGVSPVRIYGEEFDVHAQVTAIDGYSADADQAELLEWAQPCDRNRLQQDLRRPRRTAVSLHLCRKAAEHRHEECRRSGARAEFRVLKQRSEWQTANSVCHSLWPFAIGRLRRSFHRRQPAILAIPFRRPTFDFLRPPTPTRSAHPA